ncbi:restriction endonuclease subunit S [Photobacterium carnosum]|uniref:restriction endonuclease subunit S n=1 Tax=Photobacterium carnosum TaxID=2023717 RepID=UPI001E642EEB|nr:restriction endonuclease subunit S [Photobacterium carnosum]MCD9496760.1 restriction endonuclease subunit S [Photobacterium carnosum]
MKSDWATYTISDVAQRVITGKTPPGTLDEYFGGETLFVTPTDMEDDKHITETIRTLSVSGKEKLNKQLFTKGIVVSCIGWQMGKSAIVKQPSVTNQQVNTVVPDESVIDLDFLYYVLKSKREEIFNLGATATRTPILKKSLFEKISFDAPCLIEQKKIGKLLSQFDDKIQLNTQTNQTLEQMAQAIFKSWFVDFDPVKAKMNGEQPEGMDAATASLFPEKLVESELGLIPDGWEPKQLKDVLELAYGKALKKTDRVDGDVPVYGSGGLTGYHNQSLVDGPGIIVGRKGTVGSVYWEPKAFYPIDTVFYVKPKAGYALNYCHLILQNLGLKDMNTDAAVPGLNRNNAYRLDVITPSEAVLNKFEVMTQSFQSMIDANNAQNASLSLLRDTLLPKLLSGEIELDTTINN